MRHIRNSSLHFRGMWIFEKEILKYLRKIFEKERKKNLRKFRDSLSNLRFKSNSMSSGDRTRDSLFDRPTLYTAGLFIIKSLVLDYVAVVVKLSFLFESSKYNWTLLNCSISLVT